MFNVGEERITEIPSSSQLKPEFKILHSLCLFNLLPHTGNKNKVSDNDLLIMHCLSSPPSEENRLDLAYLIIQHMIIASNSKYKNFIVPYGMLLTLQEITEIPRHKTPGKSSISPRNSTFFRGTHVLEK
ncbi:hypothetical protein MTR_5g053210 [Medicago truncatula]|uniref:Uncharacterized protein n=1 Tax=Medicago truncatula TaxID=3880 RepID=G7JX19_MEDTR|nr:hypothetical protein MTR_5g053210 [Medicago truncatula]